MALASGRHLDVTGRCRITTHHKEFLADSLTPVEVYRRLARLSPVRFLFESVTGGEQVSRYSLLGVAPSQVLRLYLDRLEVETGGEVRSVDGDPLAALRRVMAGFRGDGDGDGDGDEIPLPFSGGFVGFFGFDTVRLVEHLPDRPRDPFGSPELPVAWLGRFDQAVVFDHVRQRVVAMANEVRGEVEGEITESQAREALDSLTDVLTSAAAGGGVEVSATLPEPPDSEPSLSGAEYCAAVERAQRYIEAGDIFQTVLARRWRVGGGVVEPLALYRALRMINPSPYMVLLETPEVALAGASPEMLVRKHGAKLEARPIAGTRPRGSDPEADRAYAEDLAADEKERAEHLMLVDLGRNDLGRVAAPATVRVPTFMEIERYSHVMHLVSSVEAEIDPARDALDALLACFPAGTVSGAPKIRAIEIIDELEPEARGPYAGAVGYLSYSGDMDTCITIRTLVVRDGEISVTAGAGIVADSRPEAEAEETRNKAAALLAGVALARELREQTR